MLSKRKDAVCKRLESCNSLLFQKLQFKARVNINLDIFGAQALDEEYILGFSLPLCDAQRGTSWNYSTSETVRRDTGTDKRGEERKYCSQGERRANNQGLGQHVGTQRINYAALRSRRD